MKPSLRLHRRQFLLGSTAVDIDGWRSIPLGKGMVFSHCPELPVAELPDRSGKEWLLVGNVLEADPALPRAADGIGSTDTEGLADATYSWSGRWALVSHDCILGDAGGLLPVFYDARQRGGPAIVSSSLALLAQYSEGEAVYPRRLRWSRGMDWYAPPISRLRGVQKLLPSQCLGLGALETSFVDRFRVHRWSALDNGSKSDRLLELYGHTLRQLSQGIDFISVFMTGGLDSRTTLASAIAADVPMRCFTHRRFAPKFDFDIPRTLCDRHGVPYAIVERTQWDRSSAAMFDAHCFATCVDFERDAVCHGQFGFAEGQKTVAIKSGCWEVGRCFYHKLFPFPWRDDRPTSDDIAGAWRMAKNDADIVDGLTAWLDWRREHPAPAVDWQDVYYVEQRICGWLSSVEQALDLVAMPVAQPANCQAIFDLLLSFSADERKNGKAQKSMIESVDPDLLKLPINGPRDRSYELKSHGLRVVKAGRELKHRLLTPRRR